MNPNKARIKDIAMLAGVSIGTVDRVLHDRGEVSEKTRKKIQDILKATHYSPNMMAQALKATKNHHIVSLLPEPDAVNSYWKKHPEGMSRAITELEPFPIVLSEVRFDIQNEQDFLRKTEKVLSLKPDAVLLAPIFQAESTEFCRKLKELGIPLVFIDGYISDTEFLAYIGEDVFQSGKVAGQLADMVTNRDGDILVVNIARNLKNVHHLKNRTQGFITYFSGNCINRGQKLTLNIPEPTSRAVKTCMDRVLSRHPGIETVFISGSKSHVIAEYMHNSDAGKINLIGYDLLDSNVHYLKAGVIRFLIGQRPEEQTYLAIKKLFEYLSMHKVPEKFEYLPVDIITSENVDFFIKRLKNKISQQ